MSISNLLNSDKAKTDLKFIKDFGHACVSNHWRMVVYGGYGLDAFVGHLTRNHNDLDLVIYGQQDRQSAKENINSIIHKLCSNPRIEISENPFQIEVDVNTSGFGLNLYYVQTANDPFISINQVIKSDGTIIINDPQVFPPPQKGSLGGMMLEVQDQQSHLKDILNKGGKDNPKYENDIRLLKSLPTLI